MLSASELDTARPEWSAGQVTVDMTKDFRLVLEGKASNGGFAIDQLEFNPGECKSIKIVKRIIADKTLLYFRPATVSSS